MRFAYADPPYFRTGKHLYGHLHDEAEIWDSKEQHILLLERLCSEYPDGWALSCNPYDLKWLLPHTPEDARVAAWVKTFHQIRPTTTQYAWEPVIFRGGRKINGRKPMVRDWLMCPRTIKKGVPGAKPQQFNQWVLDLLTFDPQEDQIDDLFPGSHSMTATLSTPTLQFGYTEEP